MENATDALIMAGSVLLLIIALSVAISSFTNLKVQVDGIIGARDQIQYAKDITNSDEYLNFIKNNGNDVRKVKTEAIISAIRRLRKEDYVIYIVYNNGNPGDILSKMKVSDSKKKLVQTYNNNVLFDKSYEIIEISMTYQSLFYNTKTEGTTIVTTRDLNHDFLVELNAMTNGKTYNEYIGEYQEETEPGVSDANKKTRKIITFVQN